jgi:hypothetical protein
MTVNQEITAKVNKWLREGSLKKQILQDVLRISHTSVTSKLKNAQPWKAEEIEDLIANKIIKIIVK